MTTSLSAANEVLSRPALPQRLGPAGPATARRWQFAVGMRLMLTDLGIVLLLSAGAQLALLQDVQAGWYSAGLALLWAAALAVSRSRDWRHLGTGFTEYRRLLVATVLSFCLLAALSSALDSPMPREHLLVTLPTGLVALGAGRIIWRRRLNTLRTRGRFSHRAVVIGDDAKVRHVLASVDRAAEAAGVTVVETLTSGFVAPSQGSDSLANAAVERIVDVVTRRGADLVILTETDALPPSAVRELGWALDALDVSVVVAPSVNEVDGSRLHPRTVAGMTWLHVDRPKLSGGFLLVKRAFDIVVASTALLLLAPVLGGIAVAVRLDSPGPVFFRQQRVGIHHSRFEMLKFRSMVVDAEQRRGELEEHSQGNGVLFKMKRDPRVTRVGSLLRRFSLDELPQFINVLRGEMSVVGPRPPLPQEVETYDDAANRRLLVAPGITGLWQVEGRSDLSWEESIRLDLYYVENWSVTGDIGIMMRTFRAVFGGAGAY